MSSRLTLEKAKSLYAKTIEDAKTLIRQRVPFSRLKSLILRGQTNEKVLGTDEFTLDSQVVIRLLKEYLDTYDLGFSVVADGSHYGIAWTFDGLRKDKVLMSEYIQNIYQRCEECFEHSLQEGKSEVDLLSILDTFDPEMLPEDLLEGVENIFKESGFVTGLKCGEYFYVSLPN